MLFVTRWVSLSLSVVIRCVLIPTWWSTLRLFVEWRPIFVSLSLALRIAGRVGSMQWHCSWRSRVCSHSLLRSAESQGLCNQFVHRSATCISAC